MRRERTYAWAFGALLALLFSVLITHLGNHSPYTYGWSVVVTDPARPATIEGQPVNPDALSIVPLTIGFLKPCGLDYSAPNIHLPLHSMVAASIIALTHSYMVSELVLNFGCMAALLLVLVRIGKEHSLTAPATFVAGALVVFLPWVAHYVGQPMQYAFGVTVDWIVVVAVVRRAIREEKPDPWHVGAGIAVLSFSYDWTMYVVAIVLFVVFCTRFARRRDYATMLLVGFAPGASWHYFLAWAGRGILNNSVERGYVEPVLRDWTERLAHPFRHLVDLFVVPGVALGIMGKTTTAMVGWPLLATLIVLAIRKRAPLFTNPWGQFIACLGCVYIAHQCFTASADWENSPRRAFPVVLAVAIAMIWAVAIAWESRRGRALFVGLVVLSGGLAFVDTCSGNPAPALLETGEVVRAGPKYPIELLSRRLGDARATARRTADAPMPFGTFRPVCGEFAEPGFAAFRDLDSAPPDTSKLSPFRLRAEFMVGQFATLFLVGLLLWVCVRGELLPRSGAYGGVGFMALSMVAKFFY